MQRFFESLFKQYYERLTLYAYRYVNDWQAAEDIVQDAFLSLWKVRHQVNLDASIKPYLYQTVYHKALNYIHSFPVQKREASDTVDQQLNEIIMQCTPYETLLLKELRHEIDQYIDSLPEKQRAVFKMSRMGSNGVALKNREIADALGISEKTVEKHISKTLVGLRRHLTSLGFLPEYLIVVQFLQTLVSNSCSN
jgi:RNA polymerase sigma-70 factor (ECF subfamily)